MSGKKMVIYSLVLLNAGLVLALMLGTSPSPADAQVVGARTDYVVCTATTGKYNDVLFILDVREQKLLAVRFDTQRKEFVPFLGGRELKADFKKGSE